MYIYVWVLYGGSIYRMTMCERANERVKQTNRQKCVPRVEVESKIVMVITWLLDK